jgi:hypothetical protein
MIDRAIASKINELLPKYPNISITEPRQSRKTTLAKILKLEINILPDGIQALVYLPNNNKISLLSPSSHHGIR